MKEGVLSELGHIFVQHVDPGEQDPLGSTFR